MRAKSAPRVTWSWSDLTEVHPLRKVRYDRGITLIDLKRLTHVQCSTLSMIERGLKQPTAAQQARISRVLGIPVIDLFPTKKS